MSSKIYSIIAREILDSRGNPTVETMVILESGWRGVASVPSGASVGKYEAVELRDGDKTRYNGMGVLKAVDNVNKIIAPRLRGIDSTSQVLIDQTMIALDGTEKKEKLGANSILSVSLASAVAAANHRRVPLYKHLNQLFNAVPLPTKIEHMPTPTFNVINGGKHGTGNLNFQEFHLVPATSKKYHEALQMGEELYQSVKQILTYRGVEHSVGDEGGFAPNLYTNLDALEILMEAIRSSHFHFGVDIFLGLDLAASQFKTDQGYVIKDRPSPFSTKDFIQYLRDLHKKYRLLILEDPLSEDEWEGWKEITKLFGNEVLIIGDDLLVTNLTRLERAIRDHACSGILLKPNQIGTLSEFFKVVVLAKKHDIATIVSHRSGETNDSFIADLGVAVQADYVKFGAPARGERVAKYNRLLQIESELFPSK